MADNILLGMGMPLPPAPDGARSELLVIQRVLKRVLAFTGHNIDDVINDSCAKNRVILYYKMHRWMQRETERGELERQWNPLGIYR